LSLSEALELCSSSPSDLYLQQTKTHAITVNYNGIIFCKIISSTAPIKREVLLEHREGQNSAASAASVSAESKATASNAAATICKAAASAAMESNTTDARVARQAVAWP
jgi:hypothetical protein